MGYDAVDIAACKARGIPVTNTPDVLTGDVADLGVAMMLCLSRGMISAERWVRDGSWAREGLHPLQRRVFGRKAGILGLGRIGFEVGKRLAGFDMDIAYTDIAAKDAAAREIAETTDIKAICCFSQSGTTARLIARERPSKPIIAMTHLPGSARQLVLTWGLHWVIVPQLERFKQAVVNSARAALADDFAETEDQILVIAGVPFNVPGSTNILRVAPCEERLIYATDPE